MMGKTKILFLLIIVSLLIVGCSNNRSPDRVVDEFLTAIQEHNTDIAIDNLYRNLREQSDIEEDIEYYSRIVNYYENYETDIINSIEYNGEATVTMEIIITFDSDRVVDREVEVQLVRENDEWKITNLGWIY